MVKYINHHILLSLFLLFLKNFHFFSLIKKKNLVGFKCPNVSACQNLWRSAVEQRYFFTMNSSDDIPTITTGGGLFSKQCKLRYR
mgnify:CR=1 FL=1